MTIFISTIDKNTHGTGARSLLVGMRKDVQPEPTPEISCVGATNYFEIDTIENNYDGEGNSLSHMDLQYNIKMNGKDYGLFDLTYDYINLDGVTLQTYISSEGFGTISAFENIASDTPNRFEFTPREDMINANIWNARNNREGDNPTVIYYPETRSVSVCLLSGSAR